jgi:hypothetical protein
MDNLEFFVFQFFIGEENADMKNTVKFRET